MTHDEQNKQSMEAIIAAAAAEFGRTGYNGASLNTALAESGISKGRIYHYFKSKDQVYLACVSACFDGLMNELHQKLDDHIPTLREYFLLRQEFFKSKPSFARIFFEAVEQPPEHLQSEIYVRKAMFDDFNLSVFRKQLSGLTLRSGISEADAVEYFLLFQKFYHRQLSGELQNLAAQDALLVSEQKLQKTLDILLYGIAEEAAQ